MTTRETNNTGWEKAKHVRGKASKFMADAPSVHDGHKGLAKFYRRLERASAMIDNAANALSERFADDVTKAAASIITNGFKHGILATFNTYEPPMPADRNPLMLTISIPFGDEDSEPEFELDIPECLRSLADSYADTYGSRADYDAAVAGIIAELESCIGYLRDPKDNHLAKTGQ